MRKTPFKLVQLKAILDRHHISIKDTANIIERPPGYTSDILSGRHPMTKKDYKRLMIVVDCLKLFPVPDPVPDMERQQKIKAARLTGKKSGVYRVDFCK